MKFLSQVIIWFCVLYDCNWIMETKQCEYGAIYCQGVKMLICRTKSWHEEYEMIVVCWLSCLRWDDPNYVTIEGRAGNRPEKSIVYAAPLIIQKQLNGSVVWPLCIIFLFIMRVKLTDKFCQSNMFVRCLLITPLWFHSNV